MKEVPLMRREVQDKLELGPGMEEAVVHVVLFHNQRLVLAGISSRLFVLKRL